MISFSFSSWTRTKQWTSPLPMPEERNLLITFGISVKNSLALPFLCDSACWIQRAVVKAINEKKGFEEPVKRDKIYKVMPKHANWGLVTKNTMQFFCRLGIPAGFLNCDRDLWRHRDDYKDAIKTVEHLRLSVALLKEALPSLRSRPYSNIITKKENQKQYLLQVVQGHRRLFPTCKIDFFPARSLPGNFLDK